MSTQRPPGEMPGMTDLPQDWTPTPLRYVGEITLGKMLQPSPTSENDLAGPYLRAANVRPEGRIDATDLRTMWFKPGELAELEVLPGDVLVVEGGMVGTSAMVRDDAPRGVAFQNSINRVRVRDCVDPRFVDYSLQALRSSGYLKVYCDTVSIAHLTAVKLGALRIAMPAPSTQAAVANFLDRETAQIDAMIAKQEELVALLSERRSAVIAHAVTKGLNPDAPMKDSGIEWLGVVPAHWDVRPLKRVGGLLTGSTPPTSQEFNYSDEPSDLQWVRPEDLDNSGKPTEASKWLSAEGWRASRPVPAGSVLLCCIGATLGKVGIVDRASATNQQITAIQNPETPKFLFYVLHAAQQTLWSVASGNTLPLLNNDKLGRVPVPWPEIHEREQIVAHLDDETRRLDLIVLRAKESIVLMRERRAALISDAVTGRLDIDTYGREREVVEA